MRTGTSGISGPTTSRIDAPRRDRAFVDRLLFTGGEGRAALSRMELKNLLENLMGELEKVAQTQNLVGKKPLKLGNTSMVPLCRLTMGFGTAASDASGKSTERDGALEGAGAGGALSVEPRAFVVVGKDGIPQLLSLRKGKHIVLQRAIELGETGPTLAKKDI